jgi:amino acid transporter
MAKTMAKPTERPRELSAPHAGAILYGDWGTSRFYVLGLAFYYSLYASFWYVLGVGILVVMAGWSYSVICRCFPDGGGVYSSARQISNNLAVIGALLLCADYIVTAAMSAFDGLEYLGVPDAGHLIPPLAIAGIVAIGIFNYFGLRKVGWGALIIAMATMVLTAIIAIYSIPHLATGWHRITPFSHLTNHLPQRWYTFVNVVLALSGVEAVANMTGVMVPPVKRTAKRTIFPVMAEVVILNIVLAIGMSALTPNPANPAGKFTQPQVRLQAAVQPYTNTHPDWQVKPAEKAHMAKLEPNYQRQNDIQNAALRVMATDFVGKWFGWVCGIIFGLLLFSAVNTAIGAMMSIQYTMSRSRELPEILHRLNRFGVPAIALIPAVLVPIIVLSLFHNLATLADLYAIGVVGAITINIGSTATNKNLKIKPWERAGLFITGAVMLCVEITLAATKRDALIFVLCVLGAGLLARFYAQHLRKRYQTQSALIGGIVCGLLALFLLIRGAMIWHSKTPYDALYFLVWAILLGLLAALAMYQCGLELGRARARGEIAVPPEPTPVTPARATLPPPTADVDRPRVLVATTGAPALLEFAAKYAAQINGFLFVLYVRHLNLSFVAQAQGPTLEEDGPARQTFELAQEFCLQKNIPMEAIYAVSQDVAYTILDFAATYGVEAVLMGVSKRSLLARSLQGDILTAVANQLPQDITLLVHA